MNVFVETEKWMNKTIANKTKTVNKSEQNNSFWIKWFYSHEQVNHIFIVLVNDYVKCKAEKYRHKQK